MNETLKKIILTPFNLLYRLSPKYALKSLFYLKQGHKLDVDNPQTFNEKINCLKLYYRDDLMPICADKYRVRQYVKDKGYGYILNNLLWEGFNPKSIPFSELPNKFVIKVTHGSGHNIICKDKNELDFDETIKTLNKWLKENYLPSYGEWFYDIYQPRIIIESYLENENGEIPEDYKMFCFNNINGKKSLGFTAIDVDRFGTHTRKIYDKNWIPMNDIRLTWPNNNSIEFNKPSHYEEMVEIAETLARPFPHARIDLFIIQDNIYFGEITFTENAGFGDIKPRSFHEKMGTWIKLPNEKSSQLVTTREKR